MLSIKAPYLTLETDKLIHNSSSPMLKYRRAIKTSIP